VVSAYGTQTTPGGGSANVMEMNDTAGNEGMSFTASKDFNEKTENTKNTKITADDTWTVGADRKLLVGNVLSVKVGAAQTYTVGASRTVNTDANKMIGAASETVMIGGLRTFDIGGDLVTGCASLTRLVGGARVETAIEHSNRAVKGAQTVLIGGSWNTVAGASHNVAVSGASTELISGAKSIKASKYYLKVRGALNETLASRSVKAGGDRQEGFGAAASYAIAGATTIQGSDVTVSAKSNITINAGGITISITPSSVTISSDVKSTVDCEDAGNTDYE
jgi:type VI secretion system secreted protein VgrG